MRARRPPTGRSTTPRCARPPSPGSTRSTGSAAPRPSPPWPTGPPASRRSTSSPGRATPTWPRPSASCRASSAWRPPSPVPRRSSSWPAPSAPPSFAAVDLVVQAEHGPDGLAWLVTWDADQAEEIAAEVDRIVAASSRRADLEATLATAGIVCLVDGPEQALAVANAVAPEHLQLMVPEERGLALLDLVQNAGAVFIGPWSPASMGDYLAGPNHVLPTNRTARFASALRADDFRKHIHAVRVTPEALRTLGPLVVTLAETEGLPAHADSVRRRLPRSTRRARERCPAGPPRPRADRGLPLAPGRRRGPAQHQRVAVRAARGVARGAAGRAGRGLVPPLPRPAGHRAAPGRGRPARRHARTRCSAPTAPTRCCRACCWPSGARAGAPWSSSPPTRCTATSRGSPAPRWSRGRATTTS